MSETPDACAEGEAILTVRALSGLSGDMILGGLAALAGVGDEELGRAVAELHIPVPENCVRLETRSVNGATGIGCRIDLPHEHAHRTFKDIAALIASSDMPEEAKALALRAFELLAAAEGAVHGQEPESVTFHEVGALDSIIDSCLCCRLFASLKPARFVCSPLPLADGCIHCAHGLLPSPAPAVLRMLEGIAVRGFLGIGETVTPTALSLLKALRADFGLWPEMTVLKTAISYGTKVFPDAPNGALWVLGREIRRPISLMQ
ncbi:MAG: LarC family nickel insertion protein [Desulfovibrio sp.]|nr:LarC family nickel insertion protein [Desulfovibrio sp.]